MIPKKNARKTWHDLTPKQQASVLTLASIQVVLAATAWTDLARRPSDQVRGSKRKWAAVIAVNFIGPVLYFVRGIRRYITPAEDQSPRFRSARFVLAVAVAVSGSSGHGCLTYRPRFSARTCG